MRIMRCSVLSLCILAGFCTKGQSEFVTIAPGLEYGELVLPGPVNVYVARADRNQRAWTIDTMIAKGIIKGARETVPDMVNRYADTVNFQGQRYDIKIAINGAFFNLSTGTLLGGQVIDGWFVRRFQDSAGGTGFIWTLDRIAALGGNIRNTPRFQMVSFADGGRMKIDQLNEPLGKEQLGLYTWHYNQQTDLYEEGVEEAVVRMSSPLCVIPDNGSSDKKGVPGTIVSYKNHKGGTPLLYDHVVLTARGEAAHQLRQHAGKGQGEVQIDLGLRDMGNTEWGLSAADWKDAYAGVNATQYVLVNGVIPKYWEKKAAEYAKRGKIHGSASKDPRTLVAFNDRYVFFVVVDGRSADSIGMTFVDAGEFCRDQLKATHAVNQDGGGSSTMWVEGRVRNYPSGKANQDKPGALRPVANGLFMALLQPAKRSSEFKLGDTLVTTESTRLRLGPGSQFGVAASQPAGQEGVLVQHRLTGIQAKGKYWWNCRFGEIEGWAEEGTFRCNTK